MREFVFVTGRGDEKARDEAERARTAEGATRGRLGGCHEEQSGAHSLYWESFPCDANIDTGVRS